MRIGLLIGLSLICFLGCRLTAPPKMNRTEPFSMVLKDLSPGRSMWTPIAQRKVCLKYQAIVNDKVVFQVSEIMEEDDFFLPPTSAGEGDILPFEVSGDRFQLEVLAIGTSKTEAIRIANEDPSQFESKRSWPEDRKYSVIRISPLPPS